MTVKTATLATSFLGQAVRTKAQVSDFYGKCGVVVSCRPTYKYPLQVTFLVFDTADADRRIALSCWYAAEELELITEADDGHK